ncbi:hypothetical protein DERP_013857 [Dermatophagoides pteronyssinus]|uniref:Uncharacterized protein n=1 Tax=Dermatophagoides pteronyssinus TaxID=6956 RepID=A0ABQ8J2T3_DERPT|nr:hypothetical protein DERP_013857 [Dermatophagoides pteronyssinus]
MIFNFFSFCGKIVVRKWYVPGICPKPDPGTTHIPKKSGFCPSSAAFSCAFFGKSICGNAYIAPATLFDFIPVNTEPVGLPGLITTIAFGLHFPLASFNERIITPDGNVSVEIVLIKANTERIPSLAPVVNTISRHSDSIPSRLSNQNKHQPIVHHNILILILLSSEAHASTCRKNVNARITNGPRTAYSNRLTLSFILSNVIVCRQQLFL